jgi:alginate O-acetyltransferase complex protein AlgI
MTLSQWFRDYVYIPLGGNRGGARATYRNLLIVFFLCGLWHGAAWTFVIWGLYHGFFLILERVGLGRWLAQTWRPLAHVYTLLVVLIGWVLFRSADLSQSIAFLRAMAGLNPSAQAAFSPGWFLTNDVVIAFGAAILGSMPFVPWLAGLIGERRAGGATRFALSAANVALPIGLLVLCAMSLAIGSYNPFIYFRF